jgi:hypothetical protein
MQVIVFHNEAGGVSVIHPAPEFSDQLEAVAAKDVPTGRPWRIINAADLPSREFRVDWQWTESGPIAVA